MKRSRVRASLTTGATWVGGFCEAGDFVFPEEAGFFGLHDEDALENTAVDEGYAEEGVVDLFAGFFEVLEAGMVGHVFDGDGV